MKRSFTVNTKHTEDAYRVYAKVHLDARSTPLTQAVSIVLGIVITAGGVFAIVNQGFRLLYAITVVVGLLCILSRPLGLWNMRRRLVQNAENMSMNIDYQFLDDNFTVTYPGQSETIAYRDLKRAVETEHYFFLYTDVRMAHILPKKDFTWGDPAAFAPFIAEKSGLTVIHQAE